MVVRNDGAMGSSRPTGGTATVYRGEGWEIKSVREFFPDGARYCLAAGVPEGATDEGEVWLFGDAAESAWRFPAARLMLVSPPEFCEIPTNAVVVTRCSFRQDLHDLQDCRVGVMSWSWRVGL